MKKWLQNWLGINPELDQQRYIATQAQLAQLARGLGDLTGINETLTKATEKLAGQVKLNSDEISSIKGALEPKRASRAKANPTKKD